MQADPQKSFRSDHPITRAELVEIVVNLLKTPHESKKNCDTNILYFEDVSLDQWFVPSLCIAVKNGIITGFDDGTFRARESITIAEFSKIFVNALYKTHIPKNNRDTSIPSQWYDPYLLFLNTKKVFPPSILSIDHKVTR